MPSHLLAEVTAAIDPFDSKTEAFLRSVEGERLSIAEAGAITFSVHLAARSAVLRLREMPFMAAAKISGTSTGRILFRHLAPNIAPQSSDGFKN